MIIIIINKNSNTEQKIVTLRSLVVFLDYHIGLDASITEISAIAPARSFTSKSVQIIFKSTVSQSLKHKGSFSTLLHKIRAI